ncbi:MAG: hypothetical protein DIZ78_05635 [endosymbiont of Escarpia spicata]|uniref:Uncharacterized protein n=1 Tax=endosymbiont of Escarpia spicata TaxID=2200908 RepID=A0A370DPX1_9GAMM|nr:MAG: hypothetical protein DIZ78_05635 [endosymbiont of Escarpia spicata]
MKFLTLILLLPLLQGCVSWLQRQPEPPTLASLPSRESEVEVVPVEALTPERVMDDYRALLQQSASPELTHEATRRLADLQLGQGERRLAGEAQGLPAEAVFDSAIKLYRQLLEQNDGITGRDRLYYQLARAEVLVGRLEASQQTLDRLVREHPESLYFQEAQFRRGEWLFTRADYAAAQRAYAAAVAAGGDSPFHQRALFKLGWALFKQQQFNAALDAFVALLDLRADTLSRLDSNTLTPSDRELMQDTLRVTSLCFTQQGGAEGSTDIFSQMANVPGCIGSIAVLESSISSRSVSSTGQMPIFHSCDGVPAIHRRRRFNCWQSRVTRPTIFPVRHWRRKESWRNATVRMVRPGRDWNRRAGSPSLPI